jgi:predicted nucleotidyltransferase
MMPQTITIGDALFTKTQQKIMGLVFQKPDTTFYLNQIVRQAGIGKGTIKRELSKMTAAGLLTVKHIGNQTHYQANSSAPVYNELIAITRKTFGIADVIRQSLEPIKESIEFAFIYGSIAKATDTGSSDIDLMIIGNDLAYADIMNLLIHAETELQRAINPSIYNFSDFNEKLQQGNSFLTRIANQEKIIIMGNDNVIRKIG